MRLLAALLAVCAGLAGQTNADSKTVTVNPGSRGEIVRRLRHPRAGGFLTVAIENSAVTPKIVLSDGRTITGENAVGAGLRWEVIPSPLPDGSTGRSFLLELPAGLPAGDFKGIIEVPPRGPRTNFRLTYIRNVPRRDPKAAPEETIIGPLGLEPGSHNLRLVLHLIQSDESALLDIANVNPGTNLTLRFPDGTVISQKNAEENDIDWGQAELPVPASQGDLVEQMATLVVAAMFLPIQGIHAVLAFTEGVPQTGDYTIELVVPSFDPTLRVSAMFATESSMARRTNTALGFGR